MYKLHHFSDPHLSFKADWSIQKPMDQRKWSKGTMAYVGYLGKLLDYQDNVNNWDIQAITGDITHDMPKNKVAESLTWIDEKLNGRKIVIKGNHDHSMNMAMLRMELDLKSTYLMDEGETLALGPYLFGCWSEHAGAQQADGTDYQFNVEKLLDFAMHLATTATLKKKIPVILSHYPCPLNVAVELGNLGISYYLHGHIHCTNNATGDENGVDWTWYDKSAKATDDKTINGCFFSCGTTDVLLAKHGVITKELYPEEAKAAYQKRVDSIAQSEKNVNKRERNLKLNSEVLMLVGIPGSGKSTMANILGLYHGYTVINQDRNNGNKAKTIEQFRKALEEGKDIVVDRTNFSRGQRKAFINLAKDAGYKIRAMVFEVPLETCIERVLARTDHQTTGNMPTFAKEKLVRGFNLMLQQPEMNEGFDVIESTSGEIILKTWPKGSTHKDVEA